MKVIIIFLYFFASCASHNKQTHLEINLEWQNKNKNLRISYDFPREVELVKLSGLSPDHAKYWQIQNSDLQIKEVGGDLYILSQTEKKKEFNNIVFLVETRRENLLEIPFYLNQHELLISSQSILVNALEGEIGDTEEIDFPVKLIFGGKKPKSIYLDKKMHQTDFLEQPLDTTKIFIYWGRESKELIKEDIYLSKRFKHSQKRALLKLGQQVRQYIGNEFTKQKIEKPTLYFFKGKTNSFDLANDSIVLHFDNRFAPEDLVVKYKLAIKALNAYYLKDLPKLKNSLVSQIYTDYLELKEKSLLKVTDQVKKDQWLLDTERLINKCIFSEALNYKHYRNSCEKFKVLIMASNLEKSLHSFWEKLVVENIESEDVYDELIEFYEEHALNKELEFDDIFNIEFDQQGENVIKLLNAVGFGYQPFQSQRVETSKMIAESMVEQLYTKNCQGEKSLKVFNRTIFTRGLRKCEGFIKDFYIYKVNGHHIFREAHLAYESTRLTCLTKGAITFKSLSGQSLPVNCFGLRGPLKLVHIDQVYSLK
ncbi:MAG: hypothetical protein CME62_07045 [Halobacteriovoraceae bacterium]|nr:hypothetical protein [Halobacteriovoraceae bacterium]|tara:strand:- start:11819 stop:13432 length:1614 start_codon:yes stop_codon:yes gene_type:complete